MIKESLLSDKDFLATDNIDTRDADSLYPAAHKVEYLLCGLCIGTHILDPCRTLAQAQEEYFLCRRRKSVCRQIGLKSIVKKLSIGHFCLIKPYLAIHAREDISASAICPFILEAQPTNKRAAMLRYSIFCFFSSSATVRSSSYHSLPKRSMSGSFRNS